MLSFVALLHIFTCIKGWRYAREEYIINWCVINISLHEDLIMGVNKDWKNKGTANERLNYLKSMLFESLKPYFKFSGNLDLSKTDPTTNNGDTLARILNSVLTLTDDDQDSYFGADSIVAQQVHVENNNFMRFWGRIFWLSTPKNHHSYKPNYDPFYGEFKLDKNRIQIVKMKFGDYDRTNLDKVWWFDMELDWVYEFED